MLPARTQKIKDKWKIPRIKKLDAKESTEKHRATTLRRVEVVGGEKRHAKK